MKKPSGTLSLFFLVSSVVPVYGDAPGDALYHLDNLWILIATLLVFLMHLGFASLEAGLTRAKNTVNILFKNIAVVAIGLLTYALSGSSLMFPGFAEGGVNWIGFRGWGPQLPELTAASTGVEISAWTQFFFQGMFAATCATIVSGAVAERIRLSAFLVFSAIFVALVYPVLGSWTWGGGWLDQRNFHDFAGATLVHSVGGWAALAGSLMLGPRIGKYVNSTVKPIIGHSLPLATIGVFLLWFGWFGFNAGSVGSADPAAISRVMVVTALSASAALVAAMITSWTVQRKPDLTMTLNGVLAGLVGITAGADVFTVRQGLIIGAISGVLVVLCITGFDKLRVDDPVGALSVHLVNGIWATVAVGLFVEEFSLGTQLLGVFSYGLTAFAAAMLIFFLLKLILGIRVSEEEELGGLDLGEHGMEAYTGFQIFTTQ